MKNIVYLFILFVLLGCDNSAGKPEPTICPGGNNKAIVLTVDYTTNKFLGGYAIEMPTLGHPALEMACDYKAPGDFGSVRWYDNQSQKDLFTGTTVWMGKGERTFPEKISAPNSFLKLDITMVMPLMTPLLHDEFDSAHEGVEYAPIWGAIANLQCVSWVNDSTPAYIYLYRPSVGVGNPADWYWVIFLKY